MVERKLVENLFQLMSVSESANSAAGAASASRAIDLVVRFRDHKAIGCDNKSLSFFFFSLLVEELRKGKRKA